MINVFNSGVLSAVQADRLNELLEWKSRFERITAAPPLSFSVLGGIPMIGPGLLANAVQQSDPTTPLTPNTVPAADPSGNLTPTTLQFTQTQVNGSPATQLLQTSLLPQTPSTPFTQLQVAQNSDGSNTPQNQLVMNPNGSGGTAVFTLRVVPSQVTELFQFPNTSFATTLVVTSPSANTFTYQLATGPQPTQGFAITLVGDGSGKVTQTKLTVTLVGAAAVDLVTSAVVGGVVQSTLGGTVLATTQPANDNSTKLATTAMVQAAIAAGSGGAGFARTTITVPYTSFTGSTNSVLVINIGSALPPNTYIIEGIAKHSASFKGGSINSAAADFQATDGSNINQIVTGVDVFQNVGINAQGGGNIPNYMLVPSNNLQMRLTVTGDTLNHLTQGSVDFHIAYVSF
jgi:hypothetical protein